MSTRSNVRLAGSLLALLMICAASFVSAQNLKIPDDFAAKMREYAAANVRDGGTKPDADWRYELAEGVTTRQVTYYSDDTACYGRLFFPKGFDKSKKYPGVVLGHGTNGIAIAIEKYGARFAERGLIAMVIDYRGYGYSDGWVMMKDKDTTTDDKRVTEKVAQVDIKRTRLLTPKQFEDYRSAISFLQGEPGVDADKIGVWGSSLSGGTVLSLAGYDARVKAVVGQVPATSGGGGRRPAARGARGDDPIKRAREGQGAEIEAGFSIKSQVDAEMRERNAEMPQSMLVGRIPKTTAVLLLPGEKDELGLTPGANATAKYLKDRGNPAESITIPETSHFQAYAGPAFEVTSNLAAEWFLHYLK